MPEHPHSNGETPVKHETRHDESDINIRALMTFVVVFVVFAAVSHVVLWLLFKFYVQVSKGAGNPPMTQMLRQADADVPALPRLQPFPGKDETDLRSPVADTPVADMDLMRAHEDAVLNTYGWVDRQKGSVHIPISQAQQLALQRGMFVVNTSTGVTTTGGARP